jgi:hypothetical protein
MHAMGFRIAWPFRFEGKSLVCPDAALLELFGATTTARKIPVLRGLGRVVQVSEGDVAGETCLPLLFGGKHAAGRLNLGATAKFENRCAINTRVGFQFLPLLRDILRKCGGSAHEKRLNINYLRVPY